MKKSPSSPLPQVVRAPKQDRSRASFERVLDMAAKLMEEKGYGGFALSDVVARSKVSIGSIYGRVNSKDELIRAVQQRVMAKMQLEQAGIFLNLRRRELPLKNLLTALIRELANFMARHGRMLNAFMERAHADKQVESFGRWSYGTSLHEFKLMLIERSSEMTMQNPEHAAQVCFDVVYCCLSRRFGVGKLSRNDDPGDLELLIADLGEVCLAYLTAERPVTRRRRKG